MPPDRWSFDPEAGQHDHDFDSLEPEWQSDVNEDTFDFNGPVQQGEHRRPEPSPQGRGRPNLGIIFTIAFLALLFVGPRYLEGTLFVIVLAAMVAARWLYGRWSRTEAPDAP